MLKTVLVAAVAALAVEARFLSRAPQLNGRIVGGHDANIEDYPYHVSLQKSGQHGCGGSILAPTRNIILTAAHCTDPYLHVVSILSVRYGTSEMHQGGSVINVDVQEGGRIAKATGWGQIYENGPVSEQLQVVELHEVDRDACIDVYGPQITERMICFTDVGKDTCRYDSGGPLVSQGHQIGVVSWGSGCGNFRRPGVYSNLHSKDVIDYIGPIIEDHGTD